MGFAAKDDSPAEAAIGNATYALLTKEQNAWLKNPAEEGQAITTMSRGQNLVVKAQFEAGQPAHRPLFPERVRRRAGARPQGMLLIRRMLLTRRPGDSRFASQSYYMSASLP